MMERTCPLIVDDHPVVRASLHGMLRGQPGFEVVGEAATGTEAAEPTDRLGPKVIPVVVG